MSTEQPGAPRPRRRINFEISVRRQRRWQVFGTYSATERDLALADAKKFEKDGSDGAKVTKETYNFDTDQVETTVIYRSPALEKEMIELAASRPRPASKPPTEKPAPDKAAVPAVPAAPRAAKPRKQQPRADDTLIRALPWILAALVGACLIGGAATMGTSYSLQYAVTKGAAITRQTQTGILVGVFVIVTGTIFFSQMRRILRRFGVTRPGRAQPAGSSPVSPTPAPVAPSPTPAPAPTSPTAAPAPPSPTPAPAPLPPSVAPAPAPSAAPAPALRQAQAFEAAMAASFAGDLRSLDTAQRFATNVYVGGAMDHLAGVHAMDAQACRALFAGALSRLGAPAEMAARLPDLLEGYLGQPKVRGVYQAGAAHMRDYLAGQPFDAAACVTDWQTANVADTDPDQAVEDQAVEDQVVAILFTEIVDPDAAAPDLGDDAVSATMQAHDRIVRGALADCNGVEIKHTGTGIMASFGAPGVGPGDAPPDASRDAIDAAMRIVGDVAGHAGEHPGQHFDVRIGIAAGTVVHEGGDLFGATVQLASRLCESSPAGEILASRAVRDLCGGKRQFHQLEDISLKGFPDPVSVCRVIPAGAAADRPPSIARTG